VLSSLVLLGGCGVGITPPTTSNLTGNWQIQGGTAITSPPTGFYIVGALQSQGSQASGTFTGLIPCTPPVINVTGSVDSMGNLNLTGGFVEVQLLVPANPNSLATGTLGGGGYLCQVVGGGPAVGVEIAPLTGTFAGAVTSNGANGNFSMTITQSATSNASGQFPLTGTVTFSNGVCAESILSTMSGTVSGVGMTLATGSIPVTGQNYVSVVASTNPAATQLTATSIVFQPSPCSNGSSSSTFTGTLTRQ
jgi:hypothetical protein